MRVAVIGYGRWGPNHARVFSEMATLAAIADRDRERLDQAGQKYPSVLRYTSYRDAVSVADAVIVATPVSTHQEVVGYALAQGKHVLCEKPLCLDAKMARELHRLAQMHKVVLMTGYTYLYNARARWLLDIDFGKIHTVHSECTSLGPRRPDVGVVADLATHHLALLQSWMGPAVMVSCTGQRCLDDGHDDAATVCLLYEGGVYASIYVSWLVPHKSRCMQVVGEKCMVEWDDADPISPICVYDGGARPRDFYETEAEFMHLSAWTGSRVIPSVEYVEPLRTEAGRFLWYIEHGGHNFAAFDEDLCATLEAALRSKDAYGEPSPVKVRKS